MIVRLETEDGRHIAEVTIADGRMSEVLLWRDRVFCFAGAILTGGDPAESRYREASWTRVALVTR
jgi:hypothetical protein